ncbi:hypothetical protein PTSG_03778 [Salpingoeca rosetta]|uniref:Uncharacterized protein n=1 Tax=Salpingoeca rosetta (strain ATCC 50818 / BSB-021) TaxID=946362 RepID=F2U5C6_SALR5|nr:uncharacterized protein PTSG_03778 [Salpingoeca rosetta]EGD83142.1 hypothetical protein PTSG_03778 [Salpingoeca rosetta]|eukprot:XP_004995506.1 hypothetical protein PTSG_03778 [Salpingoeca rosetta]
MVVQRLWLNFGAAYHNATAVAAQGSSDSSHNGFIVVEHASQHVPEDVVRAASRRWKAFMRLAPTFEQHTQAFTRDRAIVISGGGYQLEFVFASVRLLRLYGCTLPIELWVSSVRGEVPSVTQRRALEQIGVEVMDLDAYAGVFPELAEQMHPSKPSTKPYILKQLALVSSNCRQCLLLDADNAAVRDPTYLFSDENFVRTGHLLWPDFWHMRTGPASIRAIFGLNDDWASTSPWDVRTVESGQMVVDKARAWRTLMLSVYMQLQTEFFDNQMRALHHLGGGGDKQTFLIGCLATNSSCHIIDHPVASAARIIDGTFCGRAMVQLLDQQDVCTD